MNGTKTRVKNNKKKHGIYFDEILDVFDDPDLLEWYDQYHISESEDRYKCIGCIEGFLIVLVVLTYKKQTTRIISARKATHREKETYYEYIKKKT